jgi:hypothetical protein
MVKTLRLEGGAVLQYEKINQGRYRKLYGKTYDASRKVYDLIYTSRLVLDGHEIEGLCYPQDHKIFINVHDGKNSAWSTVLHEALHAECAEGGVRQMSCWARDLEELIVEKFSEAIAHNFKLKPEL